MSEARMLKPVVIPGPSGGLSGLLHRPAGEIRFVAVVSHPHPLFGGTMDNKVVYRIARALESLGGLVARYDFRGVRASAGTHDRGAGEQDDARSVLAFVRKRAEEIAPDASLPTVLAGFSFGSVVSSRVACAGGDDVSGLLLVGAPVITHRFEELAVRPANLAVGCVQGGRDEHGPLPELQRIWALVPEPKQLIVIETAGHFFDDEQDELHEAARSVAAPWIA